VSARSIGSRAAWLARLLAVVTLAFAGHPACRSGAGPKPKAPSGPNADAERAFVGQSRLLRYHGKKKRVSLSARDAGRASGPCDVAVEVKSASFEAGRASFSLLPIGQPRIGGASREKAGRKSPCRQLPTETSLVITDLTGDSTDTLIAEAGRVLLTPEDYLRAHGTTFERPPASDPKEVADPSPAAVRAEQRLAEGLTVKPRPLLTVDPVYRSANRKIHYEGLIEVTTVVGTDGRVHMPQVTTSLGEHEPRVLRVLPLWRYEPARRGDQPVAFRLRETTVFRIY
jgi:Gram-negative bacterial TonB protein C-terminal